MSESKLSSHLDENGHPVMIDVGDKERTRREAWAEGFVVLTDKIVQAVESNSTEKGDVLKIAELAGIMAAKRTSELIPLCHSIRLENVRIQCTLDAQGKKVKILAFAKAADVTGVEMEALTGVSVAALTVYDMCKGLDKGMCIEGIRLLRKSGGKSGDYVGADAPGQPTACDGEEARGRKNGKTIRAAVLTVSDKGARGEREDTAGPALCSLLDSIGAEPVCKAVVPDDRAAIRDILREWVTQGIHLILTTGGTGLAARDVTPDVLTEMADRVVPGLGELMRLESLKHTANAPLSRGLAVTCAQSLILAFPGSKKGAMQCFEAVSSSLRHAVGILNGWDSECQEHSTDGR